MLVDDVAKTSRTRIGKRIVADVTQFDAFAFGHFYGTFYANLRIEKYVVDAKTRCFVVANLVAYLIGGKALHRSIVAHVRILARSVVWRLALIEECPPVFSFPEGLILLEMLVEKARIKAEMRAYLFSED